MPVGRLITDPGGATACMVDYALVPECRGSGLGTAIIAAVLEQLAPQDRPMRVTVAPTNLASLGSAPGLGSGRSMTRRRCWCWSGGRQAWMRDAPKID